VRSKNLVIYCKEREKAVQHWYIVAVNSKKAMSEKSTAIGETSASARNLAEKSVTYRFQLNFFCEGKSRVLSVCEFS